jgi:hypothetical protein
MNRVRINLFDSTTPLVETLHYYSLVASDCWYQNWDLREYLPFRKQFALGCKARAVVCYDRLINQEVDGNHWLKATK